MNEGSARAGTGSGAAVLAKGASGGTGTASTTALVFRVIVLEPGATTGWHYHPGPMLALVKAGVLTRIMADGTVHVTVAGLALIEQAGPQHVHIGHNLGTEPVVVYAIYLVPEGSPLSVEAPDPRCC